MPPNRDIGNVTQTSLFPNQPVLITLCLSAPVYIHFFPHQCHLSPNPVQFTEILSTEKNIYMKKVLCAIGAFYDIMAGDAAFVFNLERKGFFFVFETK